MRNALALPSGIVLSLLLLSHALAQSIHDIQFTTDPQGDSPYEGLIVNTSGIVTMTGPDGFVIAQASGPWNAVYVYTQIGGPDIGDEVQIAGLVNEYNGMTEIKNLASYQLLSTGNSIAPTSLAASAVNQEMFESVLVTVSNLTVSALYSSGEWAVSDGAGTARCDDLDDYTYFPKVGDALQSVTGAVFYSSGNFKIEPRFTLDITGDVIPHFAIGGDVVTMNDSLDVIESAYVEILGDRIVCVGPAAPVGIPVVETSGLIYPGLIDTHNHGRYNVLDHIPFGQTFPDRYSWQSNPVYSQFQNQLSAIRNYGGSNAQRRNIYHLFETRILCAGTTTTEGDAIEDVAHEGIIVNIAERHPNRILRSTFPLGQGQSYWNARQAENWERFVVHIAEGVNASSLQEFYTWKTWGMLDSRTTIIHGVPLGATEFQDMASAGANLVWSPISNMVLYGATADIPTALAAGVNIALAPDWSPSGGRHQLEELKFARDLNDSQWGSVIQPVQFAQFVTSNAARALGAEDRIGRVAAGFHADLMVIPGSASDPYPALLAAEAEDVMLTVVSGRPMYGDPELIQQFPFLNMLDAVTVCGHEKTLATRVYAYGIPDSDKPLSLVVTQLEQAYAAATPVTCAFVGAFPVCGLVQFRRGDVNADGASNIADVIAELDHLFGGLLLNCLSSADVNDDDTVDLGDPVYALSTLFTSGPPIPAPAATCGTDPTPGMLTCDAYPCP